MTSNPKQVVQELQIRQLSSKRNESLMRIAPHENVQEDSPMMNQIQTRSINSENKKEVQSPNDDNTLIVDDESEHLHLKEDDGLFGQEVDLRRKLLKEEDANKEWNYTQFLEALLYHVVFHILMGPFCNIFFFRKPGLTMMRNFRFYGCEGLVNFQTFIWLGSAASMILFYFTPSQDSSIEELLLVWFMLLFRCISISAKYATFTKEQWHSMKNDDWTFTRVQEHLYLNGWSKQVPQAIYDEITASMERHLYQSEEFYFRFMQQPMMQTKKQLQETSDQIYPVMDQKVIKQRQSQSERFKKDYYCGFMIVAHVIRGFNYQNKSYAVPLAFIYSLLTIIITLATLSGFGYLEKEVAIDIPRHIINCINVIIGMSLSYSFYIESIRDINRKIFMCQQTCYMLSVRKLNFGSPKYLPSLNLADPETLDSWEIMRTIAIDFGLKYFLRVQGTFSVVIIFCAAEFVFLLLIVLDVIVPQPYTIVAIGFQALFHWLSLAIFMLKGAILNSYFIKFNNVLDDTQSFYVDLLKSSKQYFKGFNLINDIHLKAIVTAIDLGYDNQDKFDQYIEIMLRKVRNSINKLEYDKRNNSVNIYGVPMSMALLQSVGVGLSTILGFAAQQRFQNLQISNAIKNNAK